MPAIDLDGRTIEYRLIPGDAAKPWLVFLHEGLGCVTLWRDFPDQLARRVGNPALIYSRFGYGQSAPLECPRTPDFMHAEARVFLPLLCAALGITAPILIGHSDGASIALIRAADIGNDIRAVVLMAPHVMVETMCVESIARIAETYETTDLRQRLAKHHRHVDDAFLGWARIWLQPQFRTWSLAADVLRLACPTLLIQGQDDVYGTLAQLDAIQSFAPGPVQRVVLARCGHAAHRDQPDAVLDAISGFIERVTDQP
jgi:pimeloyl-ACP methyl ester carboxylesterase